jgi:hypothetical protein
MSCAPFVWMWLIEIIGGSPVLKKISFAGPRVLETLDILAIEIHGLRLKKKRTSHPSQIAKGGTHVSG